jgi:hypothetical protein
MLDLSVFSVNCVFSKKNYYYYCIKNVKLSTAALLLLSSIPKKKLLPFMAEFKGATLPLLLSQLEKNFTKK